MRLFGKKRGSTAPQESVRASTRRNSVSIINRVPTAKDWFSDSDEEDDEKSRVSRYSVLDEDNVADNDDKYANPDINQLWSASVDSEPEKWKKVSEYQIDSPSSVNEDAPELNDELSPTERSNSSGLDQNENFDMDALSEPEDSSSEKDDPGNPKKSKYTASSKKKAAKRTSRIFGFPRRSKAPARNGASANASKSHEENEERLPADKQEKPNRDDSSPSTVTDTSETRTMSDFGQRVSTAASIDVSLTEVDGMLNIKVSEDKEEDEICENIIPISSNEETMDSSESFEIIEAVETIYEEDDSDSEQAMEEPAVPQPPSTTASKNRFKKSSLSSDSPASLPSIRRFLSPRKSENSEARKSEAAKTNRATETVNQSSQSITSKSEKKTRKKQKSRSQKSSKKSASRKQKAKVPSEVAAVATNPIVEKGTDMDSDDNKQLEAMVQNLKEQLQTLTDEKKSLEAKIQNEARQSPKHGKPSNSNQEEGASAAKDSDDVPVPVPDPTVVDTAVKQQYSSRGVDQDAAAKEAKNTDDCVEQTTKENKSALSTKEKKPKSAKRLINPLKMLGRKEKKSRKEENIAQESAREPKISADEQSLATKSQSSKQSRISAEERKTMYTQSLMITDSTESADDPDSPANVAIRVQKTFPVELDEYPNSQSHGYNENEPHLVNCLKFYYCGTAAKYADTAYQTADCECKSPSSIEQLGNREATMTPMSEGSQFSVDGYQYRKISPKPTVEVVLDEPDDDNRDDGIIDRGGSLEELEEAPAILPSLSRTNSFVREVTDMHLSLDVDPDLIDDTKENDARDETGSVSVSSVLVPEDGSKQAKGLKVKKSRRTRKSRRSSESNPPQKKRSVLSRFRKNTAPDAVATAE